MDVTIACVVEGHAEVEAAPVLLRRVAIALYPTVRLITPQPIRLPKSKAARPGELERAVRFATLRAGAVGAVLVLLDADTDCPAELAPRLLARARASSGGKPVSVVVAKCEFEAWFLAAAESLRGVRGLDRDIDPPPDPEALRGAKEWLSGRMTGAASYKPTRHQAALAATFDIDAAARRAPSFDKFRRETGRLLAELGAAG